MKSLRTTKGSPIGTAIEGVAEVPKSCIDHDGLATSYIALRKCNEKVSPAHIFLYLPSFYFFFFCLQHQDSFFLFLSITITALAMLSILVSNESLKDKDVMPMCSESEINVGGTGRTENIKFEVIKWVLVLLMKMRLN